MRLTSSDEKEEEAPWVLDEITGRASVYCPSAEPAPALS